MLAPQCLFVTVAAMKKSLHRIFRALLAFAAALAVSSCLQNETTITLDKDGSGTIVDETILGAQMLGMMAQFGDPLDEMFSEEKAKEKAGKIGEGVKYVKTERINADGKKGARVFYEFADINKIKVEPGSVLDSMGDQLPTAAAEKKGSAVSFKYADGKLTVITPPTDFEEMDLPGGGQADADPEMEAMMKQMFADMRIGLKLNFPGGIKETNASHRDGNTIILFDVQVGQLLGQIGELEKITELGKTDETAAIEATKNLRGVKMETEKEITVTLD